MQTAGAEPPGVSCSIATLGEMPAPRHSHVVPRGYLRFFASPDSRIVVHEDVDCRSYETGVSEVGVRSNFYRRERPDGTHTWDVEQSFREVESAGIALLADLSDRWPLTLEDKAIVAQLIAAQHVRVPAWNEYIGEVHSEAFAQYRSEKLCDVSGNELEVLARTIDAVEMKTATDTYRLQRMLSQIYKAASVLGTMQWTLIDFGTPSLITSDQPVVLWPLDRPRSVPRSTSYETGLMNGLEIRFPVSSERALLMTWIDGADPVDAHRGSLHIAKNINAFTRANADRQWMHRPDFTPRFANGALLPISTEIKPGYSAAVAAASRCREQVGAFVNTQLGRLADGTEEVAIVTVSARGRQPR